MKLSNKFLSQCLKKTDKTALTRPAPYVPTPSGRNKTVFLNKQFSTNDHLKGNFLIFIDKEEIGILA